jgi:integrase
VILWLRAIFETAYTFGFRLGELRSMRCHRIDLLSNTINLDTSKNGEPRTAYMTVAVRQLIAALVVGKKAGDFLFTRNGRKLGDFRKTWANTCVRAGVGHFHCPTCDEELTLVLGKQEHCERRWRHADLRYRGLIFHDLRRNGVRGLIQTGVDQHTCMKISGHKTISVFTATRS